ncbi:MAG: HIT family protein [Clostridiales bacterium]|nr:HIT family protein [Clostridiales bacterium]
MENCIFCKIIAGSIPSTTVYEDEDFKAIMDISPAAKGHVIILPKKHVANIYEMDDNIASKVLIVAKKVAIAIKGEFQCAGLNIVQNNGELAGQTVFHYHMHVIPRKQGDKVKFTWEQGSYQDGEAEQIAKALEKRILN